MTEWQDFLGDRGTISATSKGWTDNEVGLLWLQKTFQPQSRVRMRHKNEPRLLLLDGHDSHVTGEAIDFCIRHNMKLICLPSHSTHLLQPLDVGVFLPLATYHKGESEAFTRARSVVGG